MATAHELQTRVDHLEGLLRDRDAADATAKAEALAKQQATQAATDAATRAAAATAEIEMVRRGAWASSLIAAADPALPIDFAALDKGIPATGWPEGTDPSNYTFVGGTLSKEDLATVESTFLGRTLASLTAKI